MSLMLRANPESPHGVSLQLCGVTVVVGIVSLRVTCNNPLYSDVTAPRGRSSNSPLTPLSLLTPLCHSETTE